LTLLLLLECSPKAIGTRVTGLSALLFKPLDPLLNQHLGHVADGAGFAVGQIGQALAELFG
jgi:hypothetical protein